MAEKELPDCAVFRFKSGGEFDDYADGHDVHIEPPERAGIMIVSLGENRLKPGQRFEFPEVDLVDIVERIANGTINVEVAAREYGAGVEELLEDRE